MKFTFQELVDNEGPECAVSQEACKMIINRIRSPQLACNKKKPIQHSNIPLEYHEISPVTYKAEKIRSIQRNDSPSISFGDRYQLISRIPDTPAPNYLGILNHKAVLPQVHLANLKQGPRKSFFDRNLNLCQTGPGSYTINKELPKKKGFTMTHRLEQKPQLGCGADTFYIIEKFQKYMDKTKTISLSISTKFKDNNIFQ